MLRILLLFRPIVTNQLARSVSFKDRLIRRNVRMIDSWLLLSLPAGGGGAASSVAGGQHPILAPAVLVSRGGWYQVTVSLRLSHMVDNCDCGSHAAGAWRVTERDCYSMIVLSSDRPVQCDLLTVAESAVMHVISGFLYNGNSFWFTKMSPRYHDNINVFHVNKNRRTSLL